MKVSVFFYVPNLIGYARLLLLVIAWYFRHQPFVFLPLYCLSAILDGIDGWTARVLSQTSAFGAWLDVLVDNIGRTIIWTNIHELGVFVVCVEWTVFVCTHTVGSKWKQAFGAAPWWVKLVMDNGFYTPAGVFVIAGAHGLPPYLYFFKNQPPWKFLGRIGPLLYVPIVVLGLGRLLCLMVELWCIKTHILQLINCEEDKKLHSLTRDLDRESTPT